MAAASVLVLPCRRAASGDMDGVPMVLMEAMAMGRPVVTTSLSGIPELVDASVGWLVPPEDPAALVRALREATSREECARRGERGPARLRERRFTLEDQVAGVLAAWGADRG
jgi:colanic acid/amylovoran biosynthesis glycosyltransferase